MIFSMERLGNCIHISHFTGLQHVNTVVTGISDVSNLLFRHL